MTSNRRQNRGCECRPLDASTPARDVRRRANLRRQNAHARKAQTSPASSGLRVCRHSFKMFSIRALSWSSCANTSSWRRSSSSSRVLWRSVSGMAGDRAGKAGRIVRAANTRCYRPRPLHPMNRASSLRVAHVAETLPVLICASSCGRADDYACAAAWNECRPIRPGGSTLNQAKSPKRRRGSLRAVRIVDGDAPSRLASAGVGRRNAASSAARAARLVPNGRTSRIRRENVLQPSSTTTLPHASFRYRDQRRSRA